MEQRPLSNTLMSPAFSTLRLYSTVDSTVLLVFGCKADVFDAALAGQSSPLKGGDLTPSHLSAGG